MRRLFNAARPTPTVVLDSIWRVASASDTAIVVFTGRDTATRRPATLDTMRLLRERDGLTVRYRVWANLATRELVAPLLDAYESRDSSSDGRARIEQSIRVLYAKRQQAVPAWLEKRFSADKDRLAERDRYLERFKSDIAEIQRWDMAQFRQYGAHPAFTVFGWSNRRYQFGDDVRWFQARRAFDPAEGGGGVGFMELRVGDDRLPGVYCSTGLIRPATWATANYTVQCFETDS